MTDAQTSPTALCGRHGDDEHEEGAVPFAGLTFHTVSNINRQRCERWHPGFPADGWTGADWSNAMAGEAGETCNVVKKLRRIEFGLNQAAGDTKADLLTKLATEIGDTFMYLDLLAQFYGLDLAECVTDTFNRVSIREGFPERIKATTYDCLTQEQVIEAIRTLRRVYPVPNRMERSQLVAALNSLYEAVERIPS